MSAYRESSLNYAIRLRAAIRKRDQAIASTVLDYDEASSEVDRFTAATELSLAVGAADMAYKQEVNRALRDLRAVDEEAA